jgi:DNA-binding NtrC family response regulator
MADVSGRKIENMAAQHFASFFRWPGPPHDLPGADHSHRRRRHLVSHAYVAAAARVRLSDRALRGSAFLDKLFPVDEAGCIPLDLQMAGLNGFELQDRLGKSNNALPIIFLTAHGDIKAGVQAIKAGAEDFLPKSVTREALFECVERALVRNLEQRQQQDRLNSLTTVTSKPASQGERSYGRAGLDNGNGDAADSRDRGR